MPAGRGRCARRCRRSSPTPPSIAAVLRPHPAEPIAGERVALFTTALGADPSPRSRRFLADEHGADVTAVVGSLGDRPALRPTSTRPACGRPRPTWSRSRPPRSTSSPRPPAAAARGVVFCDNRPRSLAGEPDLDAVALGLAAEVVAVSA